ncbi:MAG TPA: 30S ribosomal protein THX [Arachidicoccus sp.]
MGRGDKKTKKGKIFKGSFGNARPARPAKVKKEEAKKA